MSLRDREEGGIGWMYARAHEYPLLSADEERKIDREKWQAATDLLVAMARDATGREFISCWASNLQDNPPSLDTFDVREHYNLLKREQGELLARGRCRNALIALNKRLGSPPDRDKDQAALLALDLTGPLAVGLAEGLLGDPEPSPVAAALAYWRRFWPEEQNRPYFIKQSATCAELRDALKRYYDARADLVNHNLRLVYAIAGKMTTRGLSYEDMVQGGMPGLIRAAEKYQHERGYRFSTYAYNWIKQSMQQQVEDSQGVLRYPAGVHEQISRLYRERIEYEKSRGHEPSTRWLSQQLDLDPASLEKIRQVTNLAVSLDVRSGEQEDGLSLSETLPGRTFAATASDAEKSSLNRRLMSTMQSLKPVEREVVQLRWGLGDLTPLTRGQVADRMQVSTEWVRQLEKSALDKLRCDRHLEEAYGDYFSSA